MISLRQQYESVKVGQDYETLAIVVSQALGGKTERGEKQKPVETMSDLMTALTSIGGKIGGQ